MAGMDLKRSSILGAIRQSEVNPPILTCSVLNIGKFDPITQLVMLLKGMDI